MYVLCIVLIYYVKCIMYHIHLLYVMFITYIIYYILYSIYYLIMCYFELNVNQLAGAEQSAYSKQSVVFN